MVLTVHLLVGAAIASKIQPVSLGFLLAFLSHYCLDFLFHREYSINYIQARLWRKSIFDFLKVALDASFGVLLILIFAKNWPLALTGGVLAILPDCLTLLFLIFPKSQFLRAHYNFNFEQVHCLKKKKIPLFWEIFSQLAVVVLAILYLAY